MGYQKNSEILFKQEIKKIDKAERPGTAQQHSSSDLPKSQTEACQKFI